VADRPALDPIRPVRVAAAIALRWLSTAAPFAVGIAGLLALFGIGGEIDRIARFQTLVVLLFGGLLAFLLPLFQLRSRLVRLDYARLRGPAAFEEQGAAVARRLLRYPRRFGTSLGLGLVLAVSGGIVAAAIRTGEGRPLVAGLLPAGLLAAAVAGRLGRVTTRWALRPLVARLPRPVRAESPPSRLSERLSDALVIPLGVAFVAGIVVQPSAGPAAREAARATAYRDTALALARLPPEGLPEPPDRPEGTGAAYVIGCRNARGLAATQACRRTAGRAAHVAVAWQERSLGIGLVAVPFPGSEPDRAVAVVWYPLRVPVIADPRLVALLAALLLLAHVAGVLLGRDLGGPLRASAEILRRAREEHPGAPREPAVAHAAEILRLCGRVDDVATAAEEARRAEEEEVRLLEESRRARTQFLASISHDLKGPLNSVLGFSEILLRGMEGPLLPAQREKVRMIHQSGEDLLEIINAILDAAKIEAGRIEILPEWVPSVELVSATVRRARELAARRGLDVREETQPGLPPAFVDPERIGQALAALVSNAVKFTERGTVTIRARAEEAGPDERGRFLRIEVEDQGPGIPSEDRERIFRAFEQGDDSAARRTGGAGLGLHLAHALVAEHDGTLTFQSRPGRGTVFVVRLPLGPSGRPSGAPLDPTGPRR
jgi:signal transduction histidine kinase